MSSTSHTSAPRRGRSGSRDNPDDGPRAKFSELLPYLFEHRKVMIFVIILSILGAGASLAQPLLVSQVITIVEAGKSLGTLVWLLVGLVVVSGVISGYQRGRRALEPSSFGEPDAQPSHLRIRPSPHR